MANKELGIADPVYDALRIRSGQSIAPDLGGGSTGAGGIENKIYVWHADGSTIDTFDPDAAGLSAALAAAATGDTIWIPSIAITLTAAITIPADVIVTAISGQAQLIFGTLVTSAITLSASSGLDRLYIQQTANDANDLVTITGPSSGTARIGDCIISCTQSGAGDATTLLGDDGAVYVQDSILTGNSTSGAGYAVKSGDGQITFDDCWLAGSTAPIYGTSGSPTTVYTAGAEISTGAITVNSGAGDAISGLSIGSWYAVECTGGPFNANPADPKDSYHYTVSNDGGSNWSGLLGSTGVSMQLTAPTWGVNPVDLDGLHARFFFQATTTSILIRTGDFFWADNTGSLGWRLSAATVTTGGGSAANILTHGVRMSTVAGDPQLGDRGVWDALNYQERHTNDIDDPDGIHHTLDILDARYAANTDLLIYRQWYFDGTLAAVTDAGSEFVIAEDTQLHHVAIVGKDLGASGTTIVDVNKNGVTVFTNPARRPQLAYNDADTLDKSALPNVTSATTDDIFSVDIDQVAVGAAGLTVALIFAAALGASLAEPLNSIHVKTASDSTAYRTALIAEIWSGDGLPAAGADSVATGVSSPLSSDSTNLASVDRLTIDVTKGVVTKTAQPYVWRPTSANNRLAIVHYGHTTNWENDGMGNTVRALVDDGYVVVGVMMPDSGSTATHNTYPVPTNTVNYLRYFVEPTIRAINELESEGFDRIVMCGLSGGGWATHVISAIDTRIVRSVGVAGSLPLYMTISGAGTRDWEQLLPGLAAQITYLDLYLLSGDRSTRRTMQLLNTTDSCCFNATDYGTGAAYATQTAAQAAELGGTYQLIWDSTHSSHQISAFGIAAILAEFDE